MQVDEKGEYRELLEEDPPLFVDRVNTPWETLPHLPEYNAKAYRLIRRRLKGMRKQLEQKMPAQSHGLLILGEAGTGKTHLLMSVALDFARENHIMFIRKPNNEDAVALHIWNNMVESLTKPVPGGEQTQLDALLSHVFSDIIVRLLKEDIAQNKDVEKKQPWVERLEEAPANIFTLLGRGETRNQKMGYLRRLTLGYLREYHPEVDQTIARTLITYCLLASDFHKRTLLTWLQGQQVEEGAANQLGISESWIKLEQLSSNASLRQQREEQALRAIRTIGVLSTYYHPLVLAFDQLEGLRDESILTRRWGDAVREIFTMTPNLLVITCIFPNLWKTWFADSLDGSVLDRISQNQVELEKFTEYYARPILAQQLKLANQTHNLPDEIYPFMEGDIMLLCQTSKSIRSFLKNARQRFEDWLDGDEHVMTRGEDQKKLECVKKQEANIVEIEPQKPCENIPQKTTKIEQDSGIDKITEEITNIIEVFRKQYEKSYSRKNTNEEELFGVISTLVVFLLKNGQLSTGKKWPLPTKRVVPSNFVIRLKDGGLFCIGVCNHYSSMLRCRLENFLKELKLVKEPITVIFLRDQRCYVPEGYVRELLAKIESYGYFEKIDKKEFALLNALYATMTEIEEGLEIDNQVVTQNEFFCAVIHSGILLKSQIFSIMSREKWFNVSDATSSVSPWPETINDEFYPILTHINQHGAITEQSLIKMLGGPGKGTRNARKFADSIGQYLSQLPFKIEIRESPEGGKEYRKVMDSNSHLGW